MPLSISFCSLPEIYFHQGGYVIFIVYLLATLRRNFQMDCMKFSGKVGNANEQTIKFWWQSVSWIRICIVTLLRRALAEVCTVPVLLVNNGMMQCYNIYHMHLNL